jgi:hypothetical protein
MHSGRRQPSIAEEDNCDRQRENKQPAMITKQSLKTATLIVLFSFLECIVNALHIQGSNAYTREPIIQTGDGPAGNTTATIVSESNHTPIPTVSNKILLTCNPQ